MEVRGISWPSPELVEHGGGGDALPPLLLVTLTPLAYGSDRSLCASVSLALSVDVSVYPSLSVLWEGRCGALQGWPRAPGGAEEMDG